MSLLKDVLRKAQEKADQKFREEANKRADERFKREQKRQPTRGTIRMTTAPIRPTVKTVEKERPKTSKDVVRDIVIPQPGDPNRLNKSPAQNLNNIKNFGVGKGAQTPTKQPPRVKKDQVGDVPFEQEPKQQEQQIVSLGGTPPPVQKAGFQLNTNTIILSVIGIIVLVLLSNIKR